MSALITTGWQAGFLSILPAIETHAAIRFRRLPVNRREDAVQETIATACLNYKLLIARGQLDIAHAGTLADFAVRHVRAGRHIGGKQDGAKDVMSPVCQRRHGVRIVDCHGKPPGAGIGGWLQIAVEDRKMPIPDLAAFRIDFDAWLRTLGRRDRKIIGAMVRGERTFAVAERFGVTAGRVSQLRRRYEREWHVFQGDAA
jgi:hypothetical protein